MDTFVRGKESKREKLSYQFNDEELLIERSTDNGVVGSGIIYNVRYKSTPKGENRIVTFSPYMKHPYQEGLIMPFPVPSFDITSYLSRAKMESDFEVNTEYPKESILGSIERFGYKKCINQNCSIEFNNNSYGLLLKVFPYRNGSKLVAHITIFTKEPHDNIINVRKLFNDIKSHITEIATS